MYVESEMKCKVDRALGLFFIHGVIWDPYTVDVTLLYSRDPLKLHKNSLTNPVSVDFLVGRVMC